MTGKDLHICPVFGVHLDRTALLHVLHSIELAPKWLMSEDIPWGQVRGGMHRAAEQPRFRPFTHA